jgi:hypothetical protein
LEDDRGERSALHGGALRDHDDSTVRMLVDVVATFGAGMGEPALIRASTSCGEEGRLKPVSRGRGDLKRGHEWRCFDLQLGSLFQAQLYRSAEVRQASRNEPVALLMNCDGKCSCHRFLAPMTSSVPIFGEPARPGRVK